MKTQSRRLLTVDEAEEMTQRKAATWRRDILKRKVAYVKLVRSVRIPIEVVDAMIQRGWHAPVSAGEIR